MKILVTNNLNDEETNEGLTFPYGDGDFPRGIKTIL